MAGQQKHNLFRENVSDFCRFDPHLHALAKLTYQHDFNWWQRLDLTTPGIYILTGGRQIGKSTSCKLLIKECLTNKRFPPKAICYLTCDEIYDAKALGAELRKTLEQNLQQPFLLIIDEITYVKNWDRVIKALADEGQFQQGICLLTGSDTLILKEAAMRFPGRRGTAKQTDFHLYPLSFADYVQLVTKHNPSDASKHFNDYLQCGGYLRAINDMASYGKITESTFQTYEQWIRGDFLKQGKNEETLMAILRELVQTGVSQSSYSRLNQRIGLISKETCIDYCRLLERMDILFILQAFDQNKKQGFPRKARKFHFIDPFIYHTIVQWLQREDQLNFTTQESHVVEACVASHCYRLAKTFYFKSDTGEVDVIWLKDNKIQAIEVKWSDNLRPADYKVLQQFKHALILNKKPIQGNIHGITTLPVYDFFLQHNQTVMS